RIVDLELAHQRRPDLLVVANLEARRDLGLRLARLGLRFRLGRRRRRSAFFALALSLRLFFGLLRFLAFVRHYSLPSASPQRRHTRERAPSAAVFFTPTRTGALQRSQNTITLEISIAAAFSTMPPGLAAPRGLEWRFTMFSRSIITRPSPGSTLSTLPVLPRSRPAI